MEVEVEVEMEIGHQQTFWCHECDMSVSLLATTSSLACPHCFSDLLELMDSSGDNFLAPEEEAQPMTYRHLQDNYRLNSPVLQRLIHHLSDHSDDVVPSPSSSSSSPSPSLLPASKAYVDGGIPTVKMTVMTVCAVCKEQFAEDAEAKQLPCNHLYHPDCILPWLLSRSSCPLCRFQLPTDTPEPEDDSQRIQRLLHYRLELQRQQQQLQLLDTSSSCIPATVWHSQPLLSPETGSSFNGLFSFLLYLFSSLHFTYLVLVLPLLFYCFGFPSPPLTILSPPSSYL